MYVCVVSDMSGHILLGSKVGTMRLYDGDKNRDGNLKRAKTQLETLKEPIISVDVTADGSWILGLPPLLLEHVLIFSRRDICM